MSKMLALSFVIAGKLNSTFSGSFKKANDTVKETNKSLVDMQRELRGYERLQKQGSKEADKSAKSHERLKAQYSDSVQSLLQLNNNIKLTKNELKALTEQKKKGTISAEEFEKVQAKLKNRLKESGTEYNSLKVKTQATRSEMQRLADAHQQGKLKAESNAKAHAELAKQLEKAEQKQKRLTEITEKQQKLSDLQGKVQGFSGKSMSVGLQTAAAVTVPVYASVKYESAMADVKKVVDFDTPQQFKEMGKDILNLSKRIPIAADGLAAIVAAGGQSGIARGELTKFAEDAAKMGVAFDITADESGQMMSEWRTAFKLNQKEVVELADKVNLLGNTTAASSPKISEVVQRIGPLGEIGGLVSGEIAALGASIVGAGTAPEVASTGIKNMILSLTKGAAATKGQRDAFKALGMDATKMATYMQDDAQGAILSVLSAIKKLPKEQQTSVMTQLFGSESIGAITPLLTNMDELKDNFEKVGDATRYAGSMQSEFEARADTTENKLILLKQNTTALAITFGDTLLPHIQTATEWLGNIATKVQEFADKHPILTRNLMIGAAAFSGLALTAGAVGLTIANVIIPIGQAVMWMKKVELVSKAAGVATKIWTAAQWLFNAALSMNPIGLTIVAIAGLIAIAVILYKKFEPFRDLINGIWDAFKNTFPSAAALVEKLAGKVGELWNKFKKFLGFGGDKKDKSSSGGSDASTGGLKQIERYAKGGILTKPHIGMVAEAGPEAVIPLNGSQRAYSLWVRAGQLLGISSENGKQSQSSSSFSGFKQAKEGLNAASSQSIVYKIDYSPNITGIADSNGLKQVLQQDKQSLFEQLKKIEHERERLRLV